MKLEYQEFKFRVDAKRPLFVAISGAHSYGTVRPDSDLDVRVVRMPSLEWALALARDEKGIEHKQGKVDVVEHNLYHFLNILLHGNATFLENIFQEHVYEDPVFPEFRELVLQHGFSKRFAGHYYGFVRSSLKTYAKKKRIKNLLYAYRVLLSGRSLLCEGFPEILCNINDLKELSFVSVPRQEIIEELLEMYRTEADEIMPNNPLARMAVGDLEAGTSCFGYHDRNHGFVLSHLVDESGLPEAPRYEPFNKWIRKELLKELIE